MERPAAEIIATKLVAPRVPPHVIGRSRLRELLNEGADRPLTLLSAPAGWGKTVLLAEWALTSEGAPGPVAWVQLGNHERDRRRFWSVIVSSLGQARAELAELAVPPRGEVDAFLPTLVNALDSLDGAVVLVLDDLHEVRDPAIHADLELLLEYAPDCLRLVVCTRSDPPLRLERLRLSGRLAEVRAADLAFTLDEAGRLLDALGISLDEPDLELLWRRTEGWAAALRLAAFSLVEEADSKAFVAGFAGNDRAVSDYLLAEVVLRQPADKLAFLMRTSIVELISGGLADALTDSEEGCSTLAELAGRDGLLVATEAHGHWYRYHGMFAEVLKRQLARRLPGETSELHRRAAGWYAENDQPLQAIRHAIGAGAWTLAGEIVGERALALVLDGQGAALGELIRRIPEDVLWNDPDLALATAGLHLEDGDHGAAREHLERAYELAPRLSASRHRCFEVHATAMELYGARLRGDFEEVLSVARVVFESPWNEGVDPDVRAFIHVNLGIAEFWADQVDAAADSLRRAAGLARDCGNDYVRFVADAYAAAVALRTGRVDDAADRAGTALTLAERRGWTLLPAAAIGYMSLAVVRLWREDLEAAERLTEQAAAAASKSRERLVGPAVALAQARLLLARGDPLGALDRLRTASIEPCPRFLQVSAAMLEAEAWLALGEPARGRALLAAFDDAPDAKVAAARFDLAAGDPDSALREVTAFAEGAADPLSPLTHTEGRVVEAIARDELRDGAGALGAIEAALDLAEPRGFANPILRYGAPVRSLLRRRIDKGTSHRAFAGELLEALEQGPLDHNGQLSPLLEPLSERELTVLRFLPTMLSNTDIATEMFVSVNTVKTHLKHVYRKLDVSDRRQAVQRARDLRLLSPGLRGR
jgi:LuxR family maltose regulon positive regulatory protein